MGPLRQTVAAFVFLRSIARKLDGLISHLARANELKEMELEFMYPQLMKDRRAREDRAKRGRKPMEFGVGDPVAWTEEWRKSHPEPESDDLAD